MTQTQEKAKYIIARAVEFLERARNLSLGFLERGLDYRNLGLSPPEMPEDVKFSDGDCYIVYIKSRNGGFGKELGHLTYTVVGKTGENFSFVFSDDFGRQPTRDSLEYFLSQAAFLEARILDEEHDSVYTKIRRPTTRNIRTRPVSNLPQPDKDNPLPLFHKRLSETHSQTKDDEARITEIMEKLRQKGQIL